MKLRMRGNSIRLRLTASEVEDLASGRGVRETTDLGNGGRFSYSVEVGEELEAPTTRFAVTTEDGGRADLIALLPGPRVRSWAGSDEEGIYAEVEWEADGRLRLAVEKDYRCLTPRSAEEDPEDAYPHPKEGEVAC